MQKEIKVLSTVKVDKSNDLYKIVDCLNRTLKEKNVLFGLSLDEKENKMVFTIYQT